MEVEDRARRETRPHSPQYLLDGKSAKIPFVEFFFFLKIWVLNFVLFQHLQQKAAEIRGETKYWK